MSDLLQERFLLQLQQLEQRGAAHFFDDISPLIPLQQLTIFFDYGMSMKPMLPVARQAICALAWLALRKEITVRLIPFNDVPCLSTPFFIHAGDYCRLVHVLEDLHPAGKGNPYKAVAEAKNTQQNLSLMVSDMLSPDLPAFFDLLSQQGGKHMLFHTFDPCLFAPPSALFSTPQGVCYDASQTSNEIRSYLRKIDRMTSAMAMPSVRLAREDGWLHLAQYLFHWFGYRHVG